MVDLVVDEGGPRDRASLPLATKKGTYVRNVQRPEMPAARMREAEQVWLNVFPQIKTRSLSATYNCYGLAFANRRTHILDEKEVATIIKEDGYVRVMDRSKVVVGDLVVYRKSTDITHVGTVIEVVRKFDVATIEFVVLSQWGADGEYIHNEDTVPTLFGKVSEYYTERKLAS